MLVVGPNGAGKTNLLESLHVGTQGFSPRTRSDVQLIRFGESSARVALAGSRTEAPIELEVVLRSGEAKRARLNGAPLRAAEQLRHEVATLVFTPDRLAVVKGGPAVRRAYFDPALRRIAAGCSSRDALAPWTEQVAELGAALVSGRREVVAALAPGFSAQAAAFGLDAVVLRYEGETPTIEALEQRYERDLERGSTGLGPHLDDVAVLAGERDLRGFGSQGEQRLAVLSLLLAEADLLAERGDPPPLLLLDDVLSELDPERRRILAERIARRGQTLVTSTTAAALPTDPDQLLEVAPGRVESR